MLVLEDPAFRQFVDGNGVSVVVELLAAAPHRSRRGARLEAGEVLRHRLARHVEVPAERKEGQAVVAVGGRRRVFKALASPADAPLDVLHGDNA